MTYIQKLYKIQIYQNFYTSSWQFKQLEQIKLMSYSKQSFGIMDEGYFVPRGQIIDWINNLLELNLTKIEQLGAGSVYCQIVDVIHPGKVSMNKVNWKAKNQYQFINNLKILQNAFDKAGVKRYVEVQKLAKTKYQDNLQFIQWLKRYYDINCGDRGSSYNASERRGNVVVDFSFAEKIVVPKSFNAGGQIIGTKNEIPVKKVVPVQQVPVKVQKKVEEKPAYKQPTYNKVEQTKAGQNNGQNWKLKYWDEVEKNKDLVLKIKMIDEILNSYDNSEIKLAMVAEIVRGPQHESEKMQIQRQNYQYHANQQQDDVI